MTVVLLALVVMLAVFVVALLRSHAEILRRLAALEARSPDHSTGDSRGVGTGSALAADVVGQSLDGDAVQVGTGSGAELVLAFLSSGCGGCQALWSTLGETSFERLVVVTKGPERDSLSRLRELAGDFGEVVMSTQAWSDYAVPATPHVVLVRDGIVAGRGTGSSWEQVASLVGVARADTATTSSRAARAEAALAGAGIGAGHPSLYSGAGS